MSAVNFSAQGIRDRRIHEKIKTKNKFNLFNEAETKKFVNDVFKDIKEQLEISIHGVGTDYMENFLKHLYENLFITIGSESIFIHLSIKDENEPIEISFEDVIQKTVMQLKAIKNSDLDEGDSPKKIASEVAESLRLVANKIETKLGGLNT